MTYFRGGETFQSPEPPQTKITKVWVVDTPRLHLLGKSKEMEQ